MPKGIKGFQKGHQFYSGGEKEWFKKGEHPSIKTEFKKGQKSWNTGLRDVMRGNKANNWQGGKTEIAKRIRNSFEYEEWRTKCMERDNYICQDCGAIGEYLEVDHIKPFSLYPKLRFELSNGRTLCQSCHKKTDTYGRKLFTYKQKFLTGGY